MEDSRLPCALGGAVVGGAIALLAVWAAPRGDFVPMTVAPGVAAAAPDGARGGMARADVDLAPVLRRLDDVAGRLERIEGQVADLTNARTRVPVADRSPPAVLDADTVLAALEAAEQKKLDALSDGELLQEARWLQKGGDPTAARQRLEALLQRPLSPEERARTQIELGMLLRSRGDAESRAEAAATFQAVVDAHGLGSEVGSQAGLQLVWTQAKGNDAALGLAQAEALTNTPGVPGQVRRDARWATGILAQSLGDTQRARAEYESLLRELEGQPGQEKLIADIRRRLAGL